MDQITGRVTAVEFLPNRADGFARFNLTNHPTPFVVLLGHKARLTVDGRLVTFGELLAWLAHTDAVPVGTFRMGHCDWGASTQADFISG